MELRPGVDCFRRKRKAAGTESPGHTEENELEKEQIMLGTVLIVLLIMALLGVLPRWSHSRDWGYAPTGGVGLVIIIVVVLLLVGRI
jgi:hypothetical protein